MHGDTVRHIKQSILVSTALFKASGKFSHWNRMRRTFHARHADHATTITMALRRRSRGQSCANSWRCVAPAWNNCCSVAKRLRSSHGCSASCRRSRHGVLHLLGTAGGGAERMGELGAPCVQTFATHASSRPQRPEFCLVCQDFSGATSAAWQSLRFCEEAEVLATEAEARLRGLAALRLLKALGFLEEGLSCLSLAIDFFDKSRRVYPYDAARKPG